MHSEKREKCLIERKKKTKKTTKPSQNEKTYPKEKHFK